MHSAQKIIVSAITFLLVLTIVPAFAETSTSANEKKTQAFYDSIRSHQLTLRGFISEMPKGGDLRVQLQGSVYPEAYLALAEKENYCITLPSYFPVPPINNTCPPGTTSTKKFFETEENYQKALDALSSTTIDNASHLFSIDTLTADQFGFLLSTIVNNAEYQHLDYLEILLPWFPKELTKPASRIKWQGTAKDMFPTLAALPKMSATKEGEKLLSDFMSSTEAHLESNNAKSVMVRMIANVDRTQPPSVVFAQLIFAFKTASADPRFVGVALSGDEKHPVALRDYQLQMEMLNFLKSKNEFSDVKTVITAGYLNFGMIEPTKFKNRIRTALSKGKASRISHGSALMYENNPFALLKILSSRKIPVEIGFTAEEQARSIAKDNNPFPVLLKYHVPIVIVSVDAGLTRTDITNEYVRAARDYPLSYTELKNLVRNTLEYSLLPGKSLWKTTSPYVMGDDCNDSLTTKTTGVCQKLLKESPKAHKQWKLETEFAEFERKIAAN